MKHWLDLVHHWLVIFWGKNENIPFGKVWLLNASETIIGLHFFSSLQPGYSHLRSWVVLVVLQLLSCPSCCLHSVKPGVLQAGSLCSPAPLPGFSGQPLLYLEYTHRGYHSTGKQVAMHSFSPRKGCHFLTFGSFRIFFPSPQLSNFILNKIWSCSLSGFFLC